MQYLSVYKFCDYYPLKILFQKFQITIFAHAK